MQKVFKTAIVVIITLYLWPAFVVFVPFYNWKYAKTHGFIEWLFFGDMVATAKAFVWPYFAFASARNTPSHVNAAIDYHNKATVILNRDGQLIDRQLMKSAPQADMDAIFVYDKKALAEAEQADVGDMSHCVLPYTHGSGLRKVTGAANLFNKINLAPARFATLGMSSVNVMI